MWHHQKALCNVSAPQSYFSLISFWLSGGNSENIHRMKLKFLRFLVNWSRHFDMRQFAAGCIFSPCVVSGAAVTFPESRKLKVHQRYSVLHNQLVRIKLWNKHWRMFISVRAVVSQKTSVWDIFSPEAFCFHFVTNLKHKDLSSNTWTKTYWACSKPRVSLWAQWKLILSEWWLLWSRDQVSVIFLLEVRNFLKVKGDEAPRVSVSLSFCLSAEFQMKR